MVSCKMLLKCISGITPGEIQYVTQSIDQISLQYYRYCSVLPIGNPLKIGTTIFSVQFLL